MDQLIFELTFAAHKSYSTRSFFFFFVVCLCCLDERKYVNRVAAICNLYLAELKKESGLLSADDIKSIFLNLADIITFHNKFLRSLERAYNWYAINGSCNILVYLLLYLYIAS